MTIANINQEIRDLCNGDSNTNLLDNTTLLRRINQAYEEVVGFIIGCDGLWQFDDTNFTAFPIGTTNLIASQQDYTFASDVLEVEQVAVLDSNNRFMLLNPIDRSQMAGIDPSQYQVTTGMPMEYDKLGNSLLLYPAPAAGSVTLTNGLKVTFKRTAAIYTAGEMSTGTKQPGFASPYHVILAYKAALPWCVVYLPAKVPFLLAEIQRLYKAIAEHYGRRELDRRKVMSTKGISFR